MPDRDLLVLSEEPLNAETKLERQRGPITPAGRHYVRTHFPIPDPPAEVRIDGTVRASWSVTVEELRMALPRTVTVTLECAGNGRRFLDPKVPGEQWGLGAVGTARWTGAPLASVLEGEQLPSAVEVLFRGADEGVPKDLGRRIAYERSLPIADALKPDVIVAYAMNDEPIPREHGGPIRLIVPGWYGMASVKWLASITVLDRPFSGFYQTDRYVIDGRPLREIAPRAVITSPPDGDCFGPILEVRGYAWSGAAPVERVEVTLEKAGSSGITTASTARLETTESAYAWRAFRAQLVLSQATLPADFDLIARATDAAGNTQPLQQNRNALGYMNNAARPVRIRVRS